MDDHTKVKMIEMVLELYQEGKCTEKDAIEGAIKIIQK